MYYEIRQTYKIYMKILNDLILILVSGIGNINSILSGGQRGSDYSSGLTNLYDLKHVAFFHFVQVILFQDFGHFCGAHSILISNLGLIPCITIDHIITLRKRKIRNQHFSTNKSL